MNYYNEIKNELVNNEINKKIKNHSINRSDLTAYFNVGRMLSKAGKHYGEGIIKEYSNKLKLELNRKYSYRSLNYMLKFYRIQKVQSLTANLSWGHWIELLIITDVDKIKYYLRQSELLCLTTRQLREKIKLNEYERLDEITRNKLTKRQETALIDFVKSPILIKNIYNYEKVTEKILKKIILEDISSFMKELGNNFSFIDSEYKIKIGDYYNYIDLLLFNIEFSCYVVIELKVTELKKDHIGQIEIYMNYVDNNLKSINQNKTIGIIICKKNNKYIMEYCSDDRIIAKEYEFL